MPPLDKHRRVSGKRHYFLSQVLSQVLWMRGVDKCNKQWPQEFEACCIQVSFKSLRQDGESDTWIAWTSVIGFWAVSRVAVETILRGSFQCESSASHTVPVEAMAYHELHRSVTPSRKLKGPWHSKTRRKEQEGAHNSDHMDSGRKCHDYWGDGREEDEFIAADQAHNMWSTATIFVTSKPIQVKLELHIRSSYHEDELQWLPSPAKGLQRILHSQALSPLDKHRRVTGERHYFLSQVLWARWADESHKQRPEHLRPAIFRSLLYEACGRMLNPIHGSVGLLWSGNWAVCQKGVENILRGSFPAVARDSSASHVVPMEAMAFRELHRPVKTRGKVKGLSYSKSRRKVRERAPVSSHMDSSCKSHDDWGDITNTLQKAAENGKFNEKHIEKKSTFLSGQEVDEFIAADQAQMKYCHDLGNLKTSQTEVESPCNSVGLELTLGSQEYFPRTPDKSLAFDLRCSEAFWDQCMENYLP